MTRRLLVGAALLALPLASSHAQVPAMPAVSVFAGAGGAFALSQPQFDRSTGTAAVAGLEVAPFSGATGFVQRLAIRLEGGFTKQEFAHRSSVLGGDVQTVHAALALQAPLVQAGGLFTYALAGGAWARPSTRITLNATGSTTPGAAFEQTSHETVPGALLGVGAGWRYGAASLRAEVRWLSLATTQKATSMLPALVTVSFPVR
ncbi:MAG TPA: hypothetical protein VG818_07210 [Gemmatimonadaceae bacterium]|nr:hypothetical protein [Gemmatimonadaceae bacterium]